MSESKEFSFAGAADNFDQHILRSIRGCQYLRDDCVGLSQYFIQKNSTVLDIGCSTGKLLQSVRNYNQVRLASAKYVGLDTERSYGKQWKSRKTRNLIFKKTDARTFSGYENLSVVFSLFTLQFLPEADRLPLVRRIFNGLNEGGAFILSEKVHAKNAKIQEMLTFLHLDFKKKNFSSDDVLDKEKSIRDQMHLWSEYKIFETLKSAGFLTINSQVFWRNHLFVGILAWKPPIYRE